MRHFNSHVVCCSLGNRKRQSQETVFCMHRTRLRVLGRLGIASFSYAINESDFYVAGSPNEIESRFAWRFPKRVFLDLSRFAEGRAPRLNSRGSSPSPPTKAWEKSLGKNRKGWESIIQKRMNDGWSMIYHIVVHQTKITCSCRYEERSRELEISWKQKVTLPVWKGKRCAEQQSESDMTQGSVVIFQWWGNKQEGEGPHTE